MTAPILPFTVMEGADPRELSGGEAGAVPGESERNSCPNTTIRTTGRKVELMKNPAVQKILRDTYHLQVEFAKEGSIEMVRSEEMDCNFRQGVAPGKIGTFGTDHGLS